MSQEDYLDELDNTIEKINLDNSFGLKDAEILIKQIKLMKLDEKSIERLNRAEVKLNNCKKEILLGKDKPQSDNISILENSKKQLLESESIGKETLNNLQTQRSTMNHISKN